MFSLFFFGGALEYEDKLSSPPEPTNQPTTTKKKAKALKNQKQKKNKDHNLQNLLRGPKNNRKKGVENQSDQIC